MTLNAIDRDRARRIQAGLMTVPGVSNLMPSGADGILGSEFDAALARVIALAGGVMEARPVVTALPEGYLEMLARIESGNRPYVQADSSSASGLFQFIKSTWEGEGGKWGPKLRPAFGGLRPSVEEQRQRATSFTLRNVAALNKAGIPVNRASLYAAHFLGAGTAVAALRPGIATTTRMDTLVDAAAVKANPSILGGGETLAGFLTWLHQKTGDWAR